MLKELWNTCYHSVLSVLYLLERRSLQWPPRDAKPQQWFHASGDEPHAPLLAQEGFASQAAVKGCPHLRRRGVHAGRGARAAGDDVP